MDQALKAMPWLRMPRILEDGDYTLTMNLAKIKNKSVRERQ